MSSEKITLKDVYEIANRLEKKFDERHNDHEKRIRANENFKNRAIGIVGIVGFFGGIIGDIIKKQLGI